LTQSLTNATTRRPQCPKTRPLAISILEEVEGDETVGDETMQVKICMHVSD
jgi:hypothetical protein